MAQKPTLGKGLASLFPGAPPAGAPASAVPAGAVAAGPATPTPPEVPGRDRHPGISVIHPDEIVANPYQPRRDFEDEPLEELAQSIRANGIIQPLVVRKTPQGYELIAGERRLRAAKKVGLKQVPIVIRKSTDRESLELALIENIQRQNLNCIDEALAYFQLMQDFQMTQEEVAQRVGKERATVANYVRLLRLPEAIIDDLKRSLLSFGHGKALLSLEDLELRLQARKVIIEKRLSVRDTEALVDQMKKGAASSAEPSAAPAPQSKLQGRLATLASDLGRQWGTKVDVKGSERRGKIVIQYSSRQELDRLLGVFQG